MEVLIDAERLRQSHERKKQLKQERAKLDHQNRRGKILKRLKEKRNQEKQKKTQYNRHNRLILD